MIEAALVMYLAQQTSSGRRFLPWFHAMAENTSFALLTNASYPTCFRDYNDLLAHPASNEQEYRDEACVGSVLYPYLFVWLQYGAEQYLIEEFSSRLSQKIPDCTHQAWFPDEETDQKVWRGDTYHGICVTDLSPASGHAEIADSLNLAIKECGAIFEMTAMKRGLVPLFLTACRHYRLPIPPTLGCRRKAIQMWLRWSPIHRRARTFLVLLRKLRRSTVWVRQCPVWMAPALQAFL